MFQKSPKKMPSFKRPKSTLAQIALSFYQYALKVQRLEKILAQNASPKVQECQSYGKFRKVTLNRHFSETVERGDQGKFFKTRPKSGPRFKRPKALWRKWHYPLISIHLQCKDWKRFWRKKQLRKGLNGHVMAIQATSPKTRIFQKFAKSRPREIFQKPPIKQFSLKRPKSTLVQMALSSNQYPLIVQRLEKILAQKAAPKGPEWPRYGNLGNVTQNPHFLEKCKGQTKRNFSKIAQKVVLP